MVYDNRRVKHVNGTRLWVSGWLLANAQIRPTYAVTSDSLKVFTMLVVRLRPRTTYMLEISQALPETGTGRVEVIESLMV